MKTNHRRSLLLSVCALAFGIGLSAAAIARPCCSSCGDCDAEPLSVCCRVCLAC